MAILEAIQTVYLEATAVASVTFEDLDDYSYDHLQLRMSVKTTNTADDVVMGEMRFGDEDGISTAGYTTQRMYGENTTEAAAIDEATDAARWYVMATSKAGVTAADYSANILNIFDYQSTVKNVTWTMLGGVDSAATGGYAAFQGGIWGKPTLAKPMTQFYVSNTNLARGSEFSLYGIQD